MRRKRDSNPRTCYSQQFSRLPHSTTLPFLQGSHQVFPECGCKYITLLHFYQIFFLFFFNYFPKKKQSTNYQVTKSLLFFITSLRPVYHMLAQTLLNGLDYPFLYIAVNAEFNEKSQRISLAFGSYGL